MIDARGRRDASAGVTQREITLPRSFWRFQVVRIKG